MAINSQPLLIISISSLLLSFSAAAATNANYEKEIIVASAPISQISTAPTATPTTQSFETSSSAIYRPSLLPEPILTSSQADVKAKVNKIEKNMMVTMQKTEDVMRVIKKRLEATPGSSSSEECLKTCIEVYEEAIEGLKNSIEDLSSGNYYKVNVDISAVSTNVDTCDECYLEMLGEDPELKKFDEWVKGVTSECLGDLEAVSG